MPADMYVYISYKKTFLCFQCDEKHISTNPSYLSKVRVQSVAVAVGDKNSRKEVLKC